MNKLERDIRRFYASENGLLFQNAGGNRKFSYNYKGHTIYYNSEPNINGDPATIIINGGRDAGRRPCFKLTLKDKTATLQTLDRGDDCFVDRFDNSKELVMAAFQIAKSKGATSFELSDNSFKSCPPYKFRLSDMYFVTTGQTWYESILPLKIKSYSESKLNSYREIAKNTTWAYMSSYLISRGATIDFKFKGLDVNKRGSCMEALSIISKMRNDASCKFFNDNLQNIMSASNITSFFTTVWALDI